MKVQKMLAAVVAPTTSAELNVGRSYSDRACVQVQSAGGTFTCGIQGRVSQDAACPWHTFDSFTQADLVAGTYSEFVVLYPFMRLNLSATSGSAFSAWIGV